MSGLAPWSKVVPGTLAAFGVAGFLDWLLVHQRLLGGRQLHEIHTFAPKHQEATRERFLNMVLLVLKAPVCLLIAAGLQHGMEREGCPDSPVIMNPLRHNIPARIRNGEDLKALGEF